MEIRYATNAMKKDCEDEKRLIRNYGDSGKKIRRRLNELMAAPTLADIPERCLGRCHEHTGNRKGVFSVDLKNPFRLFFKPDGKPPMQETGGIDKRKVTKIVIVDLHADPH